MHGIIYLHTISKEYLFPVFINLQVQPVSVIQMLISSQRAHICQTVKTSRNIWNWKMWLFLTLFYAWFYIPAWYTIVFILSINNLWLGEHIMWINWVQFFYFLVLFLFSIQAWAKYFTELIVHFMIKYLFWL